MARYYRALLLPYPRAFRDEFGAEMDAAYAECAASAVSTAAISTSRCTARDISPHEAPV